MGRFNRAQAWAFSNMPLSGALLSPPDGAAEIVDARPRPSAGDELFRSEVQQSSETSVSLDELVMKSISDSFSFSFAVNASPKFPLRWCTRKRPTSVSGAARASSRATLIRKSTSKPIGRKSNNSSSSYLVILIHNHHL